MISMENITELVRQIKDKKPKRILLQLPEGLNKSAVQIVEAIEKEGIKVFLSAEPCYGACDLPITDINTDMIVHVGHNKFYKNIKTSVPVLYFPWTISVNIENVDFSVIKEKRVGLITTVQHLNALEHVSALLKDAGKVPVKGGQILGCWTENAEKIKDCVDAFLFIGSGSFHPLGLKGKKVYSLNLEKNKIEDIGTKKMEKKRFANIYKCKDAKSFGILVSTKPGQAGLEKSEKIKAELEKKHKKAFIVIMNEISSDKLLGIGVDAFINTACPRLTDNCFDKPIINAEDLKIVLE
ncbi:MAG: diphthamide biosynthesis enzyme Dph2 [Candidatus Aenigmarchaeota archaeon]|nr:diphthamide biosynthesis enzyme Dph2 [Candidatus Aenigmarchaeota archaeon]